MRRDAIDPRDLGVPGGVASRRQWRDAGAPNEMFRDGRLLNIGNAYAVPGVLDSPLDVARLVGAMAPQGAVVAGWAAALLHGVRDAGPTMVKRLGSPILLCLGRQDHRAPVGFEILRVSLADDDIEVVDGIHVTTLARTAYDMTRFSTSLTAAVGTLDAFRCELNPSPLDVVGLGPLLERSPRGRGHPMLRRAIEMSSARSRSFTESELRTRARTLLGLTADELTVNTTLAGPDRPWELDLLDWTSGLVIEYDSKHHAGTAQRERDARKDLDVREMGLDLLRVNSQTLGSPDHALAAYLRRGQRTARLGGGAHTALRLHAARQLVELPLRKYDSAVD